MENEEGQRRVADVFVTFPSEQRCLCVVGLALGTKTQRPRYLAIGADWPIVVGTRARHLSSSPFGREPWAWARCGLPLTSVNPPPPAGHACPQRLRGAIGRASIGRNGAKMCDGTTTPTMMVGMITCLRVVVRLRVSILWTHFSPSCDWTLSFVKIRRLVNYQVSTSQATARGHRGSSSRHSSNHLNPISQQALMDLSLPDHVAVLPYL
jgi:hypothetical protein